MRARFLSVAVAAMLVTTPAAAGARSPSIAEGKGVRLLGSVQLHYADDVAVTQSRGRTVAVATSLTPGDRPAELKVVDVTNPARPAERAVLTCRGIAHDVSETSVPGLVAVMGSDCLGSKGFALSLLDVSAPRRPAVVGTTALELPSNLPNPRNPWPWPSPSLSAHPDAPYLYSTRSFDGRGELLAWRFDRSGTIERASTLPLPGEPRDLDVHGEGTLLAVALGHSFATVDLADPAAPVLKAVTHCPGCFLVSEVAFAGRLGLVVSDESPNPVGCPSGPLFFYTVELGVPVLYSVYNPSVVEPDPSEEPLPRVCQVDDLDVSPNGNLATLTWHRNSVRLLYIGSAFGAGATGTESGRVIEMGWFRLDSTWASAARFLDDTRLIALDQNWGVHTMAIEPCAYRFAC